MKSVTTLISTIRHTAGCNFDNGAFDAFNLLCLSMLVLLRAKPLLHSCFETASGKKCDGTRDYNNAGCNYDGGDCKEFNEKYPNCDVDIPALINNGRCDNDKHGYDTEDCGFDGGDCLPFWELELHPNCRQSCLAR